MPFLSKGVHGRGDACSPPTRCVATVKIEKHILREAFEELHCPTRWHGARRSSSLPDGVGYSWIDSLKAHGRDRSDRIQMFEAAAFRFPINTLLTKEAYFYRAIFDEHFLLESAARTVPHGKVGRLLHPVGTALEWDASSRRMADPPKAAP